MLSAVLYILSGCGGGLVADKVAVTDYDSLVRQGWDEYNVGEYDDACLTFVRAKEVDPLQSEAYIGNGWALLRRQHPDSAAVVFKLGFSRITTLQDSVDSICGLAGSYLANGNNNKVVTILTDYPVSDIESCFPFPTHDFLLEMEHLEIVLTMAFYRLGLYSSAESGDPDNAVYHLNQVLAKTYTYTDPEELMAKMTEYLDEHGGGITE